MSLSNNYAADLIGKDRQKAQSAADYIINKQDIDAWKCLIDNSEYLFGYIKERAGNYIAKAITRENYLNILPLLKFNSPDWDGFIAQALKNFADDKVHSVMIELLINGTDEEKAYAAKFFSMVSAEKARDVLFNSLDTEYEPLKRNIAGALGQLKDQESYSTYIEKLRSDDDWEKVEAAEFLSAYGNKEAIIPILKAMSNSGMAEYIAGEAAMLVNPCEMIGMDDGSVQLLALEALDHIISGMPEVWSLGALIDLNIYECAEKLINIVDELSNSPLAGKYAQILLRLNSKISLFVNNSQYTFDEENVVLGELDEIHSLLDAQGDSFWEQMKQNLNQELFVADNKRKLTAISIISELNIEESSSYLLSLISNSDESEMVICEAIVALKKLDTMPADFDINDLLSRISDNNLQAIIQNSLIIS